MTDILPSSSSASSVISAPRKYRFATEVVTVDNSDDPHHAASVPIYQTATFKQTGATASGEYDYSRSGNPTRTHIENHMAKIMGAERALVVTSGMGALDVITRLVSSGEEIIAGDDLYGGTNRLLSFLAKSQNVKTHHVDTTKSESVLPYLSDKTRLVLLESPTNPLIKITDIPTISKYVHERCPNALVVVDNTMMSPYLQRPLELGADISYHSGTKYLSGHHDLMAGVIGVKDASVGEQLYYVINSTGCGLSPFDSWLLLRAVRMDKQQASCIRIANYLEENRFKVHYPGLRSHPQYDLHNSMSSGPGAVLSFETGDIGISERIVEGTKLWSISVSFGCVNSLISMPCRMSHASIPAQIRAERQLPEDLIRLCVGIEDVEDLLEDLQQALHSAGALSAKQ
ncbi:cystathionine beta-lyase [Rhizopus stolonifer]|uniref:Cystathionine beta-lyase n=1 Tax=Rhizopus stolonifer TaxID=4846 RepID=A0A367KSZ7_RHIST|nr:cystathionine beta-lyase [Rhizopus stolonifer]